MTDPQLFATSDGDVEKTAILSGDGVYRYHLTRSWDTGRRVVWIMLNPSTADADVDDPTIRRCMAFARAWGYAGLEVVNLYAWRSPSPRALRTAEASGVDIVGPDNNLHIRETLTRARDTQAPVIAAWGAHGDRDRVWSAFWRASWARGLNVSCLGTTKDGSPRHPLYVRGDTTLTSWTWSAR